MHWLQKNGLMLGGVMLATTATLFAFQQWATHFPLRAWRWRGDVEIASLLTLFSLLILFPLVRWGWGQVPRAASKIRQHFRDCALVYGAAAITCLYLLLGFWQYAGGLGYGLALVFVFHCGGLLVLNAIVGSITPGRRL